MNTVSQITASQITASQITASQITASQIPPRKSTPTKTPTQIAPAANRKPRKCKAPSQRDKQIYLDYQPSGILQNDLAKKYKLTQCPISQIPRRVEKWLHAA